MNNTHFERPMNSMKKTALLLTLIPLHGMANASETGKVLSSVPIVHAVAVPRQVCSLETINVQTPKTGTGATLGAMAGALAGQALGNTGGRAAATMIGMVGGAVLGHQMETPSASTPQSVQHCETQTVLEHQIKGYRVTYEYADKQYLVEWPTDPGSSIALQVMPQLPRQSEPMASPQATAQHGRTPSVTAYPTVTAPIAVPILTLAAAPLIWGWRAGFGARHIH